jgi:tRNA(His) 5'-end guanylyltransferase
MTEKRKSHFAKIGDEIKELERVETDRSLPVGKPIIARMDGRSFHTFTKDMPRPYHEPMSSAMMETTKWLVSNTNADVGYTQSDEITLVFLPSAVDSKNDAFFGLRVHKLTSVMAAMATSKFTVEVALRMPKKLEEYPVFDSRVFSVPDIKTAADAVLFRAMDCEKNAVSSAAHAAFGHKAILGKNTYDRMQMLKNEGYDWDNLPQFFKNGATYRRFPVMRMLTDKELERMPSEYRPDGPVLRTEVKECGLPPLSKVRNIVETLFYGAEPELRTPYRKENRNA